MNDSKVPGNGSAPRGAVDTEVWLLGQPQLWEYLEFVKDSAVDGADANKADLTAEWMAANEYYQALENSESGIADQAECLPLDPSLTSAAEEVVADAKRRGSFSTLPIEFGMVELDKLILYQKSVTWTFVEAIAKRLGPAPDPETLFHFCLPLGDRDMPPVRTQRLGSKRFLFRAPSSDFRFHGEVLLRPDQLNYLSFGPIAAVVGLVVGFGSNLLNVIRSDRRLLLHNGYHRACALRSLGLTHAPCMIQTVNTADELQVTAKPVVANSPDFYFRSARPPLLKDFFDPRIRRALETHRHERIIEVSFEVKDYLVPE